MEYAKLGRTGLTVSRLCLGTMTFGWSADMRTSHAILDAAVDHGINFFDTADVYSRWVEGNKGGESEQIIGEWLKGKDRRSVIIATKCRGRMWDGPNGEGLSRYHIVTAVEDSLRRLQTDYIDLYQAHAFDAGTPIDETMAAFDHLVQSGKVLYVGASNYPSWRLVESLWVSDKRGLARFDALQPHYSLFNRDEFEGDLAEVCKTYGIGVIPYSPLAAGFATGKYKRGGDPKQADTSRGDSRVITHLVNEPRAWDVLDKAKEIAQVHGVPVAHVALAWLLAKPVVTSPIIGARTVEQLTEIVGSVDLRLGDDEIAQLDQVTTDLGWAKLHRT